MNDTVIRGNSVVAAIGDFSVFGVSYSIDLFITSCTDNSVFSSITMQENILKMRPKKASQITVLFIQKFVVISISQECQHKGIHNQVLYESLLPIHNFSFLYLIQN